jgi:signal transduction histidine kinase
MPADFISPALPVDFPVPLRVLHLEDSPMDHELVVLQLRRDGLKIDVTRVETERDFLEALSEHAKWDAIISDYNLPGFSGLAALELWQGKGIELPFILVSGEIGEELAVRAMREGASDYLLKQNLARLTPAVIHAVEANLMRKAKRAADEQLRESRHQLRELTQHLQTSVEQERQAISREIHDDVGGALTALKFDLAWVSRHSQQPEIVARMQSAQETVSHAIEASQRIMRNLRPAILEQGLMAALQWLVMQFEKRTDVRCQLRMNHELPELPAGVALVAYRTAQEALTNITKHAKASQVTLDLSDAADVLSLEISDDGKGMSPADLKKAKSFGIRGLRERAKSVGGWVDLSSAEQGTTLILSIPLSMDAQLEGAELDGSEYPVFWDDDDSPCMSKSPPHD